MFIFSTQAFDIRQSSFRNEIPPRLPQHPNTLTHLLTHTKPLRPPANWKLWRKKRKKTTTQQSDILPWNLHIIYGILTVSCFWEFFVFSVFYFAEVFVVFFSFSMHCPSIPLFELLFYDVIMFNIVFHLHNVLHPTYYAPVSLHWQPTASWLSSSSLSLLWPVMTLTALSGELKLFH